MSYVSYEKHHRNDIVHIFLRSVPSHCLCLSVYPSLFPSLFTTCLDVLLITEHGLVRLVRWSHHPAGVPGGEEGPGLLRSQGAAADEGEQQPERGAPAAPEGGRECG